jgi:hypothetical protein
MFQKLAKLCPIDSGTMDCIGRLGAVPAAAGARAAAAAAGLAMLAAGAALLLLW